MAARSSSVYFRNLLSPPLLLALNHVCDVCCEVTAALHLDRDISLSWAIRGLSWVIDNDILSNTGCPSSFDSMTWFEDLDVPECLVLYTIK